MRHVLRNPVKQGAGILILLTAVTFAGCGGGALFDMWRDPQYPKAQLRNVFVVAVKKDPARRRIMEDAFVASLAKRGVSATPSYRQFSESLPDTQQVIAAVRAGGYDGVLVVSKLETKTVKTYVPGYVSTQPYTEWNRWLGRYQTYYREVLTPGYVETDEVVRHRVDVWSTQGDGHLIWTATGDSVNPSSSDQVNRQLVGKVVHELVSQGIIPKKSSR